MCIVACSICTFSLMLLFYFSVARDAWYILRRGRRDRIWGRERGSEGVYHLIMTLIFLKEVLIMNNVWMYWLKLVYKYESKLFQYTGMPLLPSSIKYHHPALGYLLPSSMPEGADGIIWLIFPVFAFCTDVTCQSNNLFFENDGQSKRHEKKCVTCLCCDPPHIHKRYSVCHCNYLSWDDPDNNASCLPKSILCSILTSLTN